MKLTATLVLTAGFSLPLPAQDTQPQTEGDIGKLLPIPSAKFVPPPPPKEVPEIKVEAAATRTLPTHQITVLRGEASTVPDIPPPPGPKPFVQGPVGEPYHLLAFSATVYDHRISQVRWFDPRTGKRFEAWCGWDWTLLSPMPGAVPGDRAGSFHLFASNIDTVAARRFGRGFGLPEVVEGAFSITRGDADDPNDRRPPPNGTVPVNVTFGDHSGSHSEKYRVQLTPLEGDVGGVRFRTNRRYGRPQTDTFRLPKGAKYKVELIHIGTDPEYRWQPRPDYDYQLEIGDAGNRLIVDDPQGIMGYNEASGSFFASGKDATLYVPLFKPKTVSFSGSTIPGWLISDDAGVTYDAPHWQDGNGDGDADDPGERRYPIAYVRDTPPTIAGKIAVKPSGLTSVSGFGAKIRVTGPGAVAIPETAANLGTDELELPATPSSGNFVNEIDYLNPMALSWEVEVNGKGHWCGAGNTANRTYVTLAVPTTALRQETLFDLGCRNADGESVEAAARDSIFGEFIDQKVSRLDGVQMTYWKNNQMGCTDTRDLLQRPDGNGNCQSWSGLFRDILRAHGIDADRFRVWPKNNDTSVIVKNWSFTSPPSGPPNHPYIVGVDAVDRPGISGQGNPDPPGSFNGHWITKSGGFYYDPSYGTPPVKQGNVDKAYEDSAFAGFGAEYGSGANTYTGIRLNDTASPAAEVKYFIAN